MRCGEDVSKVGGRYGSQISGNDPSLMMDWRTRLGSFLLL